MLSRIRKHRRLLIGGLPLILLLGYILASLIVYLVIIRQSRSFEPAVLDVPHEDITFPARDQTWGTYAFWLPNESDMALIIAHGRNMSRHSTYHTRFAETLWETGYSVLSLDLADNGGDTVEDGRLSLAYDERWDVLGGFDFLVAQGYDSEQIGLVGDSMGAATSLMALGEEACLRAAWGDSPYADAHLTVQDRIQLYGFPRILGFGGMIWAQVISGDHLRDVRPIEFAETFAERDQAVLIVAGELDTQVLYYHAEDLVAAYEAANVDVDFWSHSDLIHVQAFWRYPEAYIQRLSSFFERTLGTPHSDDCAI